MKKAYSKCDKTFHTEHAKNCSEKKTSTPIYDNSMNFVKKDFTETLQRKWI